MNRILAMDLPPEHVFIKQICAKRLGLKLILFEGLSQTSFLAYFSVYLTVLKVSFSSTPVRGFSFSYDSGGGGGGG
jgi:hypothetical protein